MPLLHSRQTQFPVLRVAELDVCAYGVRMAFCGPDFQTVFAHQRELLVGRARPLHMDVQVRRHCFGEKLNNAPCHNLLLLSWQSGRCLFMPCKHVASRSST